MRGRLDARRTLKSLVADLRIIFLIKHKRIDDITSITVSHKENVIGDMKEYRKMLSNIFGDILLAE
jgi:hypothetical protein